jgi:hypothetical protein
MSEKQPKSLTRREFRALRQIRSGFASDMIPPQVRDKLKLMGLAMEVSGGLAITDKGIERIAAGLPRRASD